MNEPDLFTNMGTDSGLNEGQTANFATVMRAKYDHTENFRGEVILNQLGDSAMLDYESGNGFGRTWLKSKYHTQENLRTNFDTPETTLKHLNSITMGEKPIMKPSELQVETATHVLTTFDTPEKIMQAQTAMGLPADGVINEQTTIAAVNYLTVYGEEEFKKQVKKALPATKNYDVLLEVFRKAESGNKTFAEGELHIGQETLNSSNNAGKGVTNTTRYGVVQENYVNSSGKTVKGFAKLEKETDYDHAKRFYNERVLPKVEKVKGIEKENQNVVSAIASLAWNRGSLPSNLDLTNETKSRAALLDVTTTGGKHSTGVVNRSIQEYEKIAVEKGWTSVASVKTIADAKDANKFNLEFYDSSGKLIYKDSKVTTTAPKSSIKANYNYTVVNGSLQTDKATLLAATPKAKTT